jgi:hypothetical protein
MKNTNPLAAGVTTSEFKMGAAGIILTSLLTFAAMEGYVKLSDVNPIIDAVGQIYAGASGLLFIFAIVREYIKSRTAIKTTIITGQKTI